MITETNHRTNTCKCKIDIDHGHKIMPIRMFKVLYPDTMISNLIKLVDK